MGRRSPRRAIMRSRSGRRPTARSTAGLTGLAERIYDIAYSPDGKWMATASGDPGIFGVAKLWLAEPGGGGKPVRDLVETQDVVFSVAFSPDSKKIATAGADRTIRIFEVETGKLLTQIEDHADWIFAVAFSPDGKRLASASRDKTEQGLRRREERVAGDLPRPCPAGLHRLVHARRQGRRHRRRGQPHPDLEPRQRRQSRSARSAASAARSSSCGTRPTARPCSLAAPTRRSTSSTPKGLSSASLQGHNDWIYSAGDLARRQDRRLGKLGRRGPALEPRRRQAAPHHHRRAGLQARRQTAEVSVRTGDAKSKSRISPSHCPDVGRGDSTRYAFNRTILESAAPSSTSAVRLAIGPCQILRSHRCPGCDRSWPAGPGA